ncbi:MAG: hypothetical protein L0271_06870, partial [Gemmatimonadetes bacterium]|nr:hypothetical protein [Gemmatimonadota bacterium]
MEDRTAIEDGQVSHGGRAIDLNVFRTSRQRYLDTFPGEMGRDFPECSQVSKELERQDRDRIPSVSFRRA